MRKRQIYIKKISLLIPISLLLSSCLNSPELSLTTDMIPSPRPIQTPEYPKDKPLFEYVPTTTSPRSPLSGRPGGANKQIFVAKIDNTPSAQPQAGLKYADLVYVTEVEGGLTRLIALFGTDVPSHVGPIRSARISDISILEPFGNVLFAYSGAQSKMLPILKEANLVDASPAAGAPGWFRETWRPVSYINLMASPNELFGWAGPTVKTQDMGWKFSAFPDKETLPFGKTIREVNASWDGSSMAFKWEPAVRGWTVWADGAKTKAAEGGSQVASTVLIQSVKQEDSGFGDRYGGRTPLITTVGSGKLWMLRNGRAWEGTWERKKGVSPTIYRYENGQVMFFAPGQVWVVLLDEKREPKFSK